MYRDRDVSRHRAQCHILVATVFLRHSLCLNTAAIHLRTISIKTDARTYRIDTCLIRTPEKFER